MRIANEHALLGGQSIKLDPPTHQLDQPSGPRLRFALHGHGFGEFGHLFL
jgi:hypothetical protein